MLKPCVYDVTFAMAAEFLPVLTAPYKSFRHGMTVLKVFVPGAAVTWACVMRVSVLWGSCKLINVPVY